MNGHSNGASHDDKLVYRHFSIARSSLSDRKVQILDKVHKKLDVPNRHSLIEKELISSGSRN